MQPRGKREFSEQTRELPPDLVHDKKRFYFTRLRPLLHFYLVLIFPAQVVITVTITVTATVNPMALQ